MKISIVTLFPKMISGFFEESIVKRAQEKELVEIEIVDLRKFAIDNYGTVDDRPYGGGVGMIMRVDVIHSALASVILEGAKRPIGSKKDSIVPPFAGLQNDKSKKIILTSPKGNIFNQQKAQDFSKLNHLIIIAGHYEDVDERVRDFVDEEISMGDFVTTGGEIAASAIADSVVRLLPGVLKKDDATLYESFMITSIKRLIEVIGENELLNKLMLEGINEVKLLEYPQYTRPEEFKGKKVPKILLSGDHKKIKEWQLKKAFE